jgi:hypothetical protein
VAKERKEIKLTREEKMELMAHLFAVQSIDARAAMEREKHIGAQREAWERIRSRIEGLPDLKEVDFSAVDRASFEGPVFRRGDG